MSLLLLIVAIPTLNAILVSEKCRSVDYYDTPWLPLDTCANSYSEDYQGSYSEKFTCDEDRGMINTSFYWGYECLSLTGKPSFTVTILDNSQLCYNWTDYSGCDDSTYWYWNSTYWYWNSTTDITTTDVTTTDVTTADVTEEPCWETVIYCYNNTWYDFNCDDSLPDCPTAYYATYTPRTGVEVATCSYDDDQSNIFNQSMVVNGCDCYNYSSYYWGDYFECWKVFCNESGIYYLWVATEDVVEYTALCDLDWTILNENNTDTWTWAMIAAGCNEDNEFISITCPDDKCSLYYCIMGYIVAIVMVYVVQCDYA